MNPFSTKFVLTDKGYVTADSDLSITPMAAPMPAAPSLFHAKTSQILLWPLFLDASNNVISADPSGNPIHYESVMDANGHPAYFKDMDNKTSFTLLMPTHITWPKARKAIVGPLLPISAVYASDTLEFDISCVGGTYSVARRFTNTVVPDPALPIPVELEAVLDAAVEEQKTRAPAIQVYGSMTDATMVKKTDKTITITINIA